jgi:hypothetical protein
MAPENGTNARWRVAAFFVLGLAVAMLLQWHMADRFGGVSALLAVGEATEPALVRYIEDQLGPVSKVPGLGHDGRFTFVVARDPFARHGHIELVESPSMRHRRVLYPALASGFGLLSPHATLWGLIVLSAVGVALSASAAAAIGIQLGARPWAPLGVLTSAGALHSVSVLTPDALGIGLSLWALSRYLRHHTGQAVILLAAAALTRETFLLFAVGLAVHSWLTQSHTRGVAVLGVPGVLVAGWAAFSALRVAGGGVHNFSAPLVGIARATDVWLAVPRLTLLSLPILAAVVIAPILAWRLRHALLLSIVVPWTLLAATLSHYVWWADAPRVLAPTWILMVLAAAVYFGHRAGHLADQGGSVSQARRSAPPPLGHGDR